MLSDVVQIGHLQLQGRLLALLLATLAAFWLTKRQVSLSGGETNPPPIADILLNGFLIVVVCWKLGVLLTDPTILWTQPAKLLLVSGSAAELAIGIALAVLFIARQKRKHHIPLMRMLDALACGITAAAIVYCALIAEFGGPTGLPWGIGVKGTISRFHPVHAYLALLLLPLLVWQQFIHPRRRLAAGGGPSLLRATMVYGGTAGMLVSFFMNESPTIIYLSWDQLVFLCLLVIGMLLPQMAHNTGRKELSPMSQNDSKMQEQQEQQNKQHKEFSSAAGKEGFVDKKLDGPNRPSV
ncbi:prolipoprotein diacylglyceryl transferase family protein [Paenibacillus aestuarii]|uniref:Prolipoprotein diacylglyceryl transferase family protein n=1 Tax=Paenibacillus aestuarii TaxID=516965 RepID=A0ABW0KE00_9BACL|nr:prolipoprotein diacylglyceryl transferase family protein [Paenibacillus aestuarii]